MKKWIKNRGKDKMNEKKNEQTLFTTKSYVSIQILPLHN